MVKSKVYQGGNLLGEAEICPTNPSFAAWNRDIRISHFSPPSERCPPLAVLHTIAVGGSCFKVESELPGPPEESLIFLMHTACFKEKKTAVMSLGETEIHLVALACRNTFRNVACFWGFSISTGLYNSCLVLMNIRCLGIVFDLDETLIVANTSRSFEDKLDALQRKINSETDPQRASVMLAEVKRYQDDRSILKQYTESDQVLDNGMVFKTQAEVVPPICDGQQPIIRPIIRLYERNIILTRINPLNRDTSVLVRLRPGWDDFRSYLTARGRKRFEVYVCTMAERDYALEMWRLLDPESNLINPKQLLDRIVCVKSGLRKSLLNVFLDGVCHPKLALVVDDRLKVWDDVDQPRVHVVPAYAPYYAPQAETNSSVPVLCIARNVACNVRACFFREFDDSLLPYISAVRFEDEISGYSRTPDVGNHLVSEDDASNGNKDPLSLDGLADVDGDRRLKEHDPPMSNNIDSRLISCIPNDVVTSSTVFPLPAPLNVVPLHGNQVSQITPSINPPGPSTLLDPSVQGSPVREEGEVPESELDPDTRRRLLILQHGQDTRDQTTNETSLPGRPLQAPLPPVSSRGNWFPVDGEISPRQLDRASKENLFDSNARFEKKRYNNPSFFRDMENRSRSNKSSHENNRFSRKMYRGEDHAKENYSPANFDSFPGEDIPSSRLSSSNRNTYYDAEQGTHQYSGSFVEALRNIAAKCGTKVEFRTDLADSIGLQFCVEVWFAGKKFGEGLGRTRKYAQLRASENSLKNLASRYISNPTFGHLPLREDSDKPCHLKQNGVVSNSSSPGGIAIRDDPLQQSQFVDCRPDGYTASSPISALKELCTLEGFRFTFQTHSSVPIDSISDGEVYAQVKVCGEVLGKGVGGTWEEAKLQAAEEALGNLNSSTEQFVFKSSSSPRSLQISPNKRLKTDLPRSFQRIPPSRYSKSGMPVP